MSCAGMETDLQMIRPLPCWTATEVVDLTARSVGGMSPRRGTALVAAFLVVLLGRTDRRVVRLSGS